MNTLTVGTAAIFGLGYSLFDGRSERCLKSASEFLPVDRTHCAWSTLPGPQPRHCGATRAVRRIRRVCEQSLEALSVVPLHRHYCEACQVHSHFLAESSGIIYVAIRNLDLEFLQVGDLLQQNGEFAGSEVERVTFTSCEVDSLDVSCIGSDVPDKVFQSLQTVGAEDAEAIEHRSCLCVDLSVGLKYVRTGYEGVSRDDPASSTCPGAIPPVGCTVFGSLQARLVAFNNYVVSLKAQ